MAAKTPPPGFVDLVTAQNSPRYSNVSIIGVVADYLPPFRNAKGQFQVTFKLQDHSTQYSSECLKVRLFDKTLECLPQIKAVGDIILLRSAKVNEYAGQILITSNSTYSTQTSHLVFSGAIIPSPAFKLDYVSGNGRLPCQGSDGLRTILGPVEQDYIITLKSALNIQVRAVDVLPPVSVGPKGPSAPPAQYAQQVEINPAYGIYSRKFKLVQDLRHRVFSDVCVEVVKKFTNPDGACELYVTDYTENKEMFYYAPPGEKNDLVRDGDQFGYNGPPKREWPGPYGFMVLKVNLSDPHASWANENVSEGAWIALENVKIKLMPNNSRLEGDMWRDQHNPTKVQIKKLTTTWKMIKDLRLRKDEYWTTYRAKVDKALEAENATAQKMTKGQKKRARQLKLQHIAEQEAAAAVKKIRSNPHIRCTYKDQPLTTISHILSAPHINTLHDGGTTYPLPFLNARYHVKARVTDFHPPKLADFALQILDSDDDDKSEFSLDMTWGASSPRWEWSFALQVEEVSPFPRIETNDSARMWINVGHLEAQHLFGNAVDDPTDLREDAALLNKLREKLYILWGDLEERKMAEDEDEGRRAKRTRLDDGDDDEQKPSNLPFNCCLQEYGALREGGCVEEIEDWERQFMMFGVTIS